jgi:hypothetical protein
VFCYLRIELKTEATRQWKCVSVRLALNWFRLRTNTLIVQYEFVHSNYVYRWAMAFLRIFYDWFWFSHFWISWQIFYRAKLSTLRPTSNLEDQVSVFLSPNDTVAQLHPQTLSFLSIAFYNSQGYGGNILTRLHTGIEFYLAYRIFRILLFLGIS